MAPVSCIHVIGAVVLLTVSSIVVASECDGSNAEREPERTPLPSMPVTLWDEEGRMVRASLSINAAGGSFVGCVIVGKLLIL
jgi:hypothetical protein